MSLIEGAGEHWNSPIEVVERMATDNELPFERAVQDEIALGRKVSRLSDLTT
jgi:hypothetical protein